MFEFDHKQMQIVDSENGDVLKLTFAHRQAHHSSIGIFDRNGVKKFGFDFRSYSIDEPQTWPKDRVTRRILLDAYEFDEQGHGRKIFGPHPEIERIVEFYRAQAITKTDFVAFEFVDERDETKEPKPLSQEELRAAAERAGWAQSKQSHRKSC